MALPGTAITATLANGVYQHLAYGALAVFLIGAVAYLASRKFPDLFSRLPWVLSAAFSQSEEEAESKGVRTLRLLVGVLWIIDAILITRPSVILHMATGIITPNLNGQPAPIAWLMRSGLYLWRFDPFATAAAVAWLEVAAGLLLIAGARQRVRRFGAHFSIFVGLFIWAIQQFFGGLFVHGASVLSGAPGAGLLLAAAGLFLGLGNATLAKEATWRKLGIGLGVFWVLGAALQAMPFEGFWSGNGLPAIFGVGESASLPSVLGSPISFLLGQATTRPALWNLLLVLAMALIGLGFLLGIQLRRMAIAATVFAILAWWLGMGFGFTGPIGTDLGSALVLASFSAVLIIAEPQAATKQRRVGAHALGASFGLAALCVGIIPTLLALPTVIGAVPSYAAVADGGGLTIVNKPAPPFSLYDSKGNKVTLSGFKGKAVVLTFIDPVCYDTCEVMTKQIVDGVASLGAEAKNVEIVAIDINPSFITSASLAQYEQEHSLTGVANWHFLTGSLKVLDQVWADYGVTPTNGIIGLPGHAQIIYFIDPQGKTLAATPDGGGPSPKLIHSYSALIASVAKAALGA